MAAQFIGIDLQKPFLEVDIAVKNGSRRDYPSNGINFASAGSGVLRDTNKDWVITKNFKLFFSNLENLINGGLSLINIRFAGSDTDSRTTTAVPNIGEPKQDPQRPCREIYVLLGIWIE